MGRSIKMGIVMMVVFAAIMTVSCRQEHYLPFDYEGKIPSSVKVNATLLNVDTLQLSDGFIDAKDFFVYSDTILIVLNKERRNGHCVELYNINSSEHIGSYYTVGNGPGEMLKANVHVRYEDLIVHDYARSQIGIINLDSAVRNGSYHPATLKQYSNSIRCPFVTMYNNRILMLNPYYFHDEKYSIHNDVDKFIFSNEEDLPFEIGNLYYTYNVSAGFIVTNRDYTKAVYASCFYDDIELYGENLLPLKHLTGPDKLEHNYRIEEKEVVFNKVVPYSYRSFAVTDQHIYVSYIGSNLEPKQNLRDFKTYIFKFDWELNLLDSYYTHAYIGSLSISNDEKSFYGRGFDMDGTPVLLKLTNK